MRSQPIPFAAAAVLAVVCARMASCSGDHAPAPPEVIDPVLPREYRSVERPSLGIWAVLAYARHEGATAEVAVKFMTTYGRDKPVHTIEGDAPEVEAVIAGEVAALRSAPPPGVLTMTALSGRRIAHADYVFGLPASAQRDDPPSYDLSVELNGERATLTMRPDDPREEDR